MLFPPLLLVASGLLFGLMPTLVDPVLGAAVLAMAPGFDPTSIAAAYDMAPVMESLLGSLMFGGLIYLFWDRLHALLGRLRHFETFGPESWYRGILAALPAIAASQTRLLQHGLLPRYLMMLVGVTTLTIMALLLVAQPPWILPGVQTMSIPVFGASLLIAGGALAALFVGDHFVLLLVSGLVGYGSAILFLFTGAPDLAFTQFAVETVFVVVAAAVLLRLRRLQPSAVRAPAESLPRTFPLGVAVAFGTTLVVLLLLVSGLPFDRSLSDFFAGQSWSAAHGRNVVNVVIVDFRALDTLGEIAVLAFALLAALPLLRVFTRRRP